MELSLADGPAGSLPGVDPVMDPESRAWVAALAGQGGDREAALGRLHALLLRAARFELGRRRGQLAGLSAAERHDLATQAADDAMMGVLARLGDFRGLSRFTTWAYKFALLEAATKARRMAWRDRELPRPPEDWVAMADPDGRPEAAAEHAEPDRYVELELAGQDPDVQLPGLGAHLAGCPACREEHESLRALLAAEGD
jgi:DNA-directed RNA polymerase specialized sigma24 family protein